MEIFIIALVFLLGGITGALVLWQWLPQRLKHHIDYRQRWEDAVTLLGNQGQLTDEQVALIRGGAQPVVRPEPAAPQAEPARNSDPVVSRATLRTLHNMATWDRRETEIARARRGLPPLDDLEGMASWDVREVLKARTKFGTG